MPTDSPAHRRARAILRLRPALAALLILVVLPAAANAYTLVLRSGRQVTLPEVFHVTRSAVIYEASPGFRVTVWLSSVDIPATERANGEPAGGFLKRIGQSPAAAHAPAAGAAQAARGGRKVVTNRELEPSRVRRAAAEEEYERTRLGRRMPSLAEVRESAAERDRELHEWAEAERRAAEVDALKEELVSVRRRLDELGLNLSRRAETYGPVYADPYPYPYLYAPPAHVFTTRPFGRRGPFGRGRFGGPGAHRRSRHPDAGLGRAFPLNNAAPPPRHSQGMAGALPAPAAGASRRHR